MRIQHNIPAMSSYRNYTNNTAALAKNLERLSSGYKINRAGDDAAGLAISEKMRAQITGLEVAQKNAKDGISLVQTAEGALTEVHDMLNRMYSLAEQSANGTYDDEVDRNQLNKEVNQLKEEINRIADSTNFNGIKLLDGSMSSNAVTKVEISGKDIMKAISDSPATAGRYTQTAAMDAANKFGGLTAGDTITYNVGLNDGTSVTLNFTIGLDKDGKATELIADSGEKYAISASGTAGSEDTTAIKAGEVGKAVLAELNKTKLADDFDISLKADDQLEFLSKKTGSEAPQVGAIDYTVKKDGKAVTNTDNTLGVTVQGPLDEGVEITASAITLWDGTNYDKAMFEINGHKFVVMGNATNFSSDVFMNANNELPDGVTILVASSTGTKGLASGDANFAQNIAKIANVTGLTVTKGVAEKTDFGGAANVGASSASGIRLSVGKKGVDKRLTLQIGDTAESFNQLKVDISDCHTKGMGIDGIDISTQDGASAAMQKIKDAINYVSDVRGTLGATQNRLDHTINNLSVMQQNIQDAESTIRDVDVAEEMMEYTKNSILVQSAQAMLAQANQLPQGVLQLLQ